MLAALAAQLLAALTAAAAPACLAAGTQVLQNRTHGGWSALA